MDCLIRNLSDKGACLEIDSARVTVDEFDLVILPEYLNRKCRVVLRWIGVRFVLARAIRVLQASRACYHRSSPSAAYYREVRRLSFLKPTPRA